MYLEEVLPDFRKGAKIRSVLWRRGQYLRMAILKDRAVFESSFGLSDTLFYKSSWYPFEVYYYNASIYNKYKELCEQHKKEIEDLFNNKEVIVKSISDKKWYERFLRRK